MGIPGLIDALGSGDRISLAKLAINHLQRTSRPIRVAIDVSIWLFQVQAGRGGVNPEIRTLFFRLLRLVALPIHPLFVFDGAQKPREKRGKVIRAYGPGAAGPTAVIRRSKELLDLFHFPYHTAPGEAEAECAKMQTAGVVDAVMSNDIDAVMFGSKLTVMNYSKESASGSKVATHVNVYRTENNSDGLDANVKLDRAGMILFALLSGGDYVPAGVPRCGPKLAAEISRAGFGSELLQAANYSHAGMDEKLAEWRSRLQTELHENEAKHFSCKHRAVQIPETFPDRKILLLYSQPIVSTDRQLETLQQLLEWDKPIDINGLRTFVNQEFGWGYISGTKRLVKVLSGPLVLHRLRLGLPPVPSDLVRRTGKSPRICGQRTHFMTDGLPELRLEIIPADVVGLDLDLELGPPGSQEYEAELEDAEIVDIEADELDPTLATSRSRASYDPTQRERIWVFESLAEVGMPDVVKAWKDEQQKKLDAKNAKKSSSPRKKRVSKRNEPKVLDPSMKTGAIRQYFPAVKKSTTGSPKRSWNLAQSEPAPKFKFPIGSPEWGDFDLGSQSSYDTDLFTTQSTDEFVNSSAVNRLDDEDELIRGIDEIRISDTPPKKTDVGPDTVEAISPRRPVISRDGVDHPTARFRVQPIRDEREQRSASIFRRYRDPNLPLSDCDSDDSEPSEPPSSAIDAHLTTTQLAELFEKQASIKNTCADLPSPTRSKENRSPRNPQTRGESQPPPRSRPDMVDQPDHDPSAPKLAIETRNGRWNYTTEAADGFGKKSEKQLVRGRVSILDLS